MRILFFVGTSFLLCGNGYGMVREAMRYLGFGANDESPNLLEACNAAIGAFKTIRAERAPKQSRKADPVIVVCHGDGDQKEEISIHRQAPPSQELNFESFLADNSILLPQYKNGNAELFRLCRGVTIPNIYDPVITVERMEGQKPGTRVFSILCVFTGEYKKKFTFPINEEGTDLDLVKINGKLPAFRRTANIEAARNLVFRRGGFCEQYEVYKPFCLGKIGWDFEPLAKFPLTGTDSVAKLKFFEHIDETDEYLRFLWVPMLSKEQPMFSEKVLNFDRYSCGEGHKVQTVSVLQSTTEIGIDLGCLDLNTDQVSRAYAPFPTEDITDQDREMIARLETLRDVPARIEKEGCQFDLPPPSHANIEARTAISSRHLVDMGFNVLSDLPRVCFICSEGSGGFRDIITGQPGSHHSDKIFHYTAEPGSVRKPGC
jgi:hypothetical protein